MGSASREALASARSVLDGTAADARAAAELLSVTRLLSGNAALRAAFADAGADSGATIALVSRVFGSSVAPEALPVLESVATGRWSTADELVAGVEELGIRAEARTADASALAAELFAFARVVASDAGLELALGNKLGGSDSKTQLVRRLLDGKASAAAVEIITHLVADPRGRRVGAMLAAAARIVADQGGRLVATVQVAAPLSDEQANRLTSRLAALYSRDVDLDVVVDPATIGGIRVQVGDDVIDGSVQARINDLRQKLAG